MLKHILLGLAAVSLSAVVYAEPVRSTDTPGDLSQPFLRTINNAGNWPPPQNGNPQGATGSLGAGMGGNDPARVSSPGKTAIDPTSTGPRDGVPGSSQSGDTPAAKDPRPVK